MKIARVIMLTAALASLCMPSEAQLWHYRASFGITEADFCDTLTIEWEKNQLYIPVTIRGKVCRFLFDTGASQTVVFKGTSLADGELMGHQRSYDAVGNVDTVPVVAMAPMKIGRVTLYGCNATVQQRTTMQQAFDGILGFDLINGGLSVKIDVASRRMIISDRQDAFRNEEGALRTRYRLNYHVPIIDVTPFGKRRCRALFDTGSRQFFSMNIDDYQRSADNDGDDMFNGLTIEGRSQGQHAIGMSGTEGHGDVLFMRLDNLRIADFAFSDVHTITTAGGTHVGAMLLNYGSVAFCPRKREMFFTPYDEQQPCAVGNKQTEIAFVATPDGRPQVGLVWPGGIPYSVGLRQGDIIEMIDQRSVRSLAQFISWPFIAGREYVFTVLSANGQRHDVRWVRMPKEQQ